MTIKQEIALIERQTEQVRAVRETIESLSPIASIRESLETLRMLVNAPEHFSESSKIEAEISNIACCVCELEDLESKRANQ